MMRMMKPSSYLPIATMLLFIVPSLSWMPTTSTSSIVGRTATHTWTTTPAYRKHSWTVQRHALYSTPSDNTSSSYERMGLNEIQTLFREAVSNQDFETASKLSNELAERISKGAYIGGGNNNTVEDTRKKKRLSWKGLGTAPWLEDRLDNLKYTFPTTIQINAFESVNSMLGVMDDDDEGDESNGSMDIKNDKETLEELIYRKGQPGLNMGVVISGSTGSGKTLAYLVPLLSTLSESLFTRQRIRVKSEEDIGDIADDLMSRVAVQTSPSVRGHGRKQVGGGSNGSVIATGAAISSLGKSGTDVKNPLALIVVPTRELGVQTALLLYELVGGSTKKTATEMPGLANMFKVSQRYAT